MTDRTNPIIETARKAAKRAYAEPASVYSSNADAALAGAEAAMRVLLERLLTTASAFTEGRRVVAASVLEDLLRELGDDQ
jgi:hypothetical protein